MGFRWLTRLEWGGWGTGELRDMYSCASVAFVGGSLIPGLAGHNLAEAARVSCAVITGKD